MRPFWIWMLYLAVVFLGGALLAPWLYWLTQWGSAHWDFLKPLADNPFHRFVSRSFLFMALAGLWPLAGVLKMGKPGRWGWQKAADKWSGLAFGFCLGLGSMAVLVGLALMMGARELGAAHSVMQLLVHFLKTVGTAIIVAVIEETVFRGMVLGSFRQGMGIMPALMASSAIYSLVHFFQRLQTPASLDWTSGLAMLPGMLSGFVDWQMLLPGFINLFLVGLILGWAFIKTGNLYLSAGLHAGWIFWLKYYGYLTLANSSANPWIWGTNKLVDGWVAMPILAAAGVVLVVRLNRRGRKEEGPD